MTADPESWAARHRWLVFAARRGTRLVVSLIVVLTASFAMIHLVPGDPVRAALGMQAPSNLVAAKRHQLGLDNPLGKQYVDYLHGVLTGHLGTSLVSGEPVTDVIAARLPNTLELAALSFVVVVALAIPVGLGMAILTRGDRRRGVELVYTTASGLLGSMPGFVLAAALATVFAVEARILPVAGKHGPASLVLPVLSLALPAAAILSRIVRVEARAVLGEDYLRTARGKRLPARMIYLRHALPNMLTASLTVGGILLTGLVAGTLLVENVFSWPGLGTTVVQSVTGKDYAVVQAVILVLGGTVLLVNLVVDVLLAVLDPRSTILEG